LTIHGAQIPEVTFGFVYLLLGAKGPGAVRLSTSPLPRNWALNTFNGEHLLAASLDSSRSSILASFEVGLWFVEHAVKLQSQVMHFAEKPLDTFTREVLQH
jgi:hypothetical protein